jgi:hypothetical protein
MTDAERILSNLKMRLDHKCVGVIRYKRSLHFFEPLQKAFAKGKIEGYEEAIKEIEDLKGEASE